MIKNPLLKRRVSIALMGAGGLLLLLAPENAWVGLSALAVGVALEIIGVRVGHSE
jgi:hypothetical protein